MAVPLTVKLIVVAVATPLSRLIVNAQLVGEAASAHVPELAPMLNTGGVSLSLTVTVVVAAAPREPADGAPSTIDPVWVPWTVASSARGETEIFCTAPPQALKVNGEAGEVEKLPAAFVVV